MIRFNLSSVFAGKFDAAKGTVKDISVITEGEALGHGMMIDTKTLTSVWDLMKGKVTKSYWKHAGWNEGDRLGEEFGLLSSPYIDTATKQLKANFQVLEAFRSTYPERWAYFSELVVKAPKELGLSIHFGGNTVWVLDDGSEIPADGERPSNALGQMPFVRAVELHSADLVSRPAANKGGLFEQGIKETELLDNKQALTTELATLATSVAAAGEQLKAKDATISELNGKLTEALTSVKDSLAAFKAKEEELAALKTERDAKVKELSEGLATATTALESAKAEAVTKEATYNAQLAAMNKTLLNFGAVPINLYSEVIDHKATLAAIENPADKRRYWEAHKSEILGFQP